MLESMNDYWRGHPPLHLMVAAYLGIEPETKPANDLSEFFATVQQGAHQP